MFCGAIVAGAGQGAAAVAVRCDQRSRALVWRCSHPFSTTKNLPVLNEGMTPTNHPQQTYKSQNGSFPPSLPMARTSKQRGYPPKTIPFHQLTWKCTYPLSKRKVVFLQGSVHKPMLVGGRVRPMPLAGVPSHPFPDLGARHRDSFTAAGSPSSRRRGVAAYPSRASWLGSVGGGGGSFGGGWGWGWAMYCFKAIAALMKIGFCHKKETRANSVLLCAKLAGAGAKWASNGSRAHRWLGITQSTQRLRKEEGPRGNRKERRERKGVKEEEERQGEGRKKEKRKKGKNRNEKERKGREGKGRKKERKRKRKKEKRKKARQKARKRQSQKTRKKGNNGEKQRDPRTHHTHTHKHAPPHTHTHTHTLQLPKESSHLSSTTGKFRVGGFSGGETDGFAWLTKSIQRQHITTGVNKATAKQITHVCNCRYVRMITPDILPTHEQLRWQWAHEWATAPCFNRKRIVSKVKKVVSG